MNEQNISLPQKKNGFIKPPAYPFNARDLFGDLRHRLADEHRLKMTLERLGQMMGQSISTTHHWFDVHRHPHILGFMTLLERLSPSQRHAFIDEHCRVFPSLGHPYLTHSAPKLSELLKVLKKRAGLTLITGATESSRTFLLTAFGHSLPGLDEKQRGAVGIDLHHPRNFVPVANVSYIDGLQGLQHVRALTRQIWPKILTSKAPLILFNRVWSSLPELRDDIVRLAQYKHVVLADEEMPDRAKIKRIHQAVDLLTLAPSKRVFGGISVDCRCKKR